MNYLTRGLNPIKSSLLCSHTQKKIFPLRQHLESKFTTTRVTTAGENDTSRQKSLRLYRILLRQSQRLFPEGKEWLLQPALNPRDYGQAQTFSPESAKKAGQDKVIFDLLKLFCKWSNLGDEEKAGHFDACWSWFISVMNDTEYYKQELQNDAEKRMDWEEELLNSIDETNNHDSLWVSNQDLKRAIRDSFRNKNADTDNITPIHGLAIQAVRLLHEQESMKERTSISVHKGIRVVATSRCIGTASSRGTNTLEALEVKHRFAYRVRVENLPTSKDTVQLLGRKWSINETNDDREPVGDPVLVVALTTGAVGHLPVLKPGQAFAYMSGCELSTRSGTMDGCFQMAVVPEDTESAIVGDAVDALSSKSKFEMPVKPFLLLAK